MKVSLLTPALFVIASTATAQDPRGASTVNHVEVFKDESGSRLRVDGRDFFVYGMNWDYQPVGTNYTYNFWSETDEFIVKALSEEMPRLRDLGVNVIRQYATIPPRWVRYIYETYGIFTVVNHLAGRYGIIVDGVFRNPVDYSDPATRQAITDDLARTIAAYKDTPGVLMWLIGNENNYGLFWKSAEIENLPSSSAQNDARATYLYSLYGELIDQIHDADTEHPVAIANGDLQFLDLVKKYCSKLDIFGTNVYRGPSSGDAFARVRNELDLPFMYTEFGADAYDAKRNREDGQQQARYLVAQWQEIYHNAYGHHGAGNAVGGMVFQWSDGWWKYQQDFNLGVHDPTASWSNAAYPADYTPGVNNMNEEWFGICAKGKPDGDGHYTLYPREAYYALQHAFKLDPYASDDDQVAAHFSTIRLSDAELAAQTQRLSAEASTSLLRVSDMRFDFDTYSTGGDHISDSARDRQRFDHLESVYLGVSTTERSPVQARLVLNALGGVPTNPIDEIFFENRGQSQELVTPEGDDFQLDGIQRLKIYRATIGWETSLARIDAFYRVGHSHWGYEGDFFGLFPDANYEPSVDMFNANTPNGVIVTGKGALEGAKLAFGTELWWGANPTVIGKYYKKLGDVSFSLIHQEDVARQGDSFTSSVIPQPKTRRTTVYGSTALGNWGVEAGGIMSGTNRIGMHYSKAEDAGSGSSYLGSGYYVLDDSIHFLDTLGAKLKVTYTAAPLYFYAQGGYRGLVADGGPDPTITFTGWGLKESGQGNHWAASTGAAYNFGNFQIAPNMLAQRPLVGPLPQINDYFDNATGTYYAGTRLRNQLQDPFWVRSNRETYGFELLITYDPTPATWMWAWDNLDREDAPFAAALDITYRILPTSQDAGVAINAEGNVFAFAAAPPARNLLDVGLRTIVNFSRSARFVNWVYGGRNQPNGDSTRLIYRIGTQGRFTYKTLALDYFVKVNDWGPYDYHRDFNLTFPLQTMLDASYGLHRTTWFVFATTRVGVRGKVRLLDENSNRFLADSDDPDAWGREWEIKTYVQLAF